MKIDELTLDGKVRHLTPKDVDIKYLGFYASFRLRNSSFMTVNGERHTIPIKSLSMNMDVASETWILDCSVLYDTQNKAYIIKKDSFTNYNATGLIDITQTYFGKAELPRILRMIKGIKDAAIISIVFDDIKEGHPITEVDFVEKELFNAQRRQAELTPNDEIAIIKSIEIYTEYLNKKIPILKRDAKYVDNKDTYELNESKIISIYDFDPDVWGKNTEVEDLIAAVRHADFSPIYEYSKKAKCRFIIYIISFTIDDKEWYKKVCDSIEIKPRMCSGSNVPEEWKERITEVKNRLGMT